MRQILIIPDVLLKSELYTAQGCQFVWQVWIFYTKSSGEVCWILSFSGNNDTVTLWMAPEYRLRTFFSMLMQSVAHGCWLCLLTLNSLWNKCTQEYICSFFLKGLFHFLCKFYHLYGYVMKISAQEPGDHYEKNKKCLFRQINANRYRICFFFLNWRIC